MAESVKSPGIEISQVITDTPVTPVTPTLAPCVVGPCYEVMEAVVEGLPNISSKINGLPYTQFPLQISSSDFPTNNTSTSELIFDQDHMDVTLVRNSGGRTAIKQLDESSPGSSFLTTINIATRPAFAFNFTRIANVLAGTIYLTPNNNNFVGIKFDGGESVFEFRQAFELAGFSATIHTVVASDVFDDVNGAGVVGNQLVIISLPDNSSSYGANASLTMSRVRPGFGNANAMHTSLIDIDAVLDVRVEGSGLIVSSNDPSVINLSKGNFYAGDFADSDSYVNDNQDDDWSTNATAVNQNMCPLLLKADAWGNFTEDNTIVRSRLAGSHNFDSDYDLEGGTSAHDGDSLYIDGVNIGQVSNVTASSVRVVSVDTSSSRYAEDGSIIYQRYAPVDLTGVEPRFAYVRANNLTTTSADYAEHEEVLVNGANNFTQAISAKIELFNANLDGGAGDGTSPGLILKDNQLIVRLDDLEEGLGQPQVVLFESNFDGANGIAELGVVLNDALEGITATVAAGKVTLEAVEPGAHKTLVVLSALEGSSATLAFRESIAVDADYLANNYTESNTGTDAKISTLANSVLHIYYDGNSAPVVIRVEDDSINKLVRQINDAVFFPSAKFDNDVNTLTIRSGLKGRPASIKVHDVNSDNAQFDGSLNISTGRPLPELTVGLGGATVNISSQIFRSPNTGEPLPWNSMGSVDIHVSYKALRRDVTPNPASGDAGLVKVSSLSQLVSAFSPISTENPLGLGLYYALINAGLDGTEVSAVGVSAVTDAEPEGTLTSYQQALELISAHEVYAIAPLTSSETVIEAFDAHVKTLSLPENRAERVLISAPVTPDREESTPVASGVNAKSTGTLNTIQLDEGHADELGDYIDALANPIPFSDNAYVSININGELRNYSLQSVSGSNIVVRTNVPYNDNLDGFFSVEHITSSASFEGSDYTIFIRGSSLQIPGTTLLDGSRLSATIRNTARQYANRRQLRLFPDTVSSVISGVETVIPSYYFAAALAGDTAFRPAQDPLTRNSLNGFSGVVGPKLTESQLDIVAAGNAVVHVQQDGEDPVIRMQCTTDVDALENREYSIVKAIDLFSKTLRKSLLNQIGRFNITQDYLDNIGLIVGAVCNDAVQDGLLANAEPVKIEQDSVQRDTLIVDVAIAVLYPANYIKLTIVV